MVLTFLYFFLSAIIVPMQLIEMRNFAAGQKPFVDAQIQLEVLSAKHGREVAETVTQRLITTTSFIITAVYLFYYALIIVLMDNTLLTIASLLLIVYAAANVLYASNAVKNKFKTPKYHRPLFILETAFVFGILAANISRLFF